MKYSTGKIRTLPLIGALTICLISTAAPHYAGTDSDCAACHGSSFVNSHKGDKGGASLLGQGDRGVGVIEKGEISNVVGNFGLLSDFHWFSPALHWPANGSDVQQYSFGLNLLVAVDGNVISSFSDPGIEVEIYDWEAKDDSRGELHCSERTDNNTAADETPFLAHSDIRDTWPDCTTNPHWPGPFRIDIDSTSATFGEEVEGEFTSDRDIFCEFNDEDNEQEPLGITVSQRSYSYGRPYAEDFFFMDFWIKNESGDIAGTSRTDYKDVYVGLAADIKNDFNEDDLIGKAKIGHESDAVALDFVFEWDSNLIAENLGGGEFTDWVGPVAYTGVGLVKSPDGAGITNFHYFDDAETPIKDEEVWPLLISDPEDPNLDDSSLYFHGPDTHIDTDSLNGDFLDPDPTDDKHGADITFIFSAGPFDLAHGDSVNFALVFVMGEDSTDLFDNAKEAFLMAQELGFQGSTPPAAPVVSGVSGERQATIVWNAEPSESSRDARTSEQDFEGYRVYRSTNRGRTWGDDTITNEFGELIGYVPLAQYDLADSIVGKDPLGYRHLGDDTGLGHSFVDTDLMNGYEYWYCVTAYDRGDTVNLEPSLENGLGVDPRDSYLVSITPGVDPTNVASGSTPEGNLEPIGGPCEGTVQLQVIDPSALTGHEYRIAFNDSELVTVEGEDTTWTEQTFMSLEDLDKGTDPFIFTDAVTGEEFTFVDFTPSRDDLPVVDGFRISAQDIEEDGVSEIGWTVVNGDTSTFDWWTENRLGHPWEFDEVVISADDWKIVVTEPESTISLAITDGPAWYDNIAEYDDVPIRVYKVTDPGNEVDVSEYVQIIDLAVAPLDPAELGPLGYDLIPGGKGYNPATGEYPVAGDLWPDLIRIRDNNEDWVNEIWLRTQNGPEDATPPSPGDEFTIRTYKPFREGITYQFQTTAPQVLTGVINLDAIKVVPNPYIVTTVWEESELDRKIQFNHLPSQCTIDIYTIGGDHVVGINHDDDSGDEFWDLRNRNEHTVAYGLYVYVVKTPGGQKKIGKFLIIK